MSLGRQGQQGPTFPYWIVNITSTGGTTFAASSRGWNFAGNDGSVVSFITDEGYLVYIGWRGNASTNGLTPLSI